MIRGIDSNGGRSHLAGRLKLIIKIVQFLILCLKNLTPLIAHLLNLEQLLLHFSVGLSQFMKICQQILGHLMILYRLDGWRPGPIESWAGMVAAINLFKEWEYRALICIEQSVDSAFSCLHLFILYYFPSIIDLALLLKFSQIIKIPNWIKCCDRGYFGIFPTLTPSRSSPGEIPPH